MGDMFEAVVVFFLFVALALTWGALRRQMELVLILRRANSTNSITITHQQEMLMLRAETIAILRRALEQLAEPEDKPTARKAEAEIAKLERLWQQSNPPDGHLGAVE